jgi:RNA polymerase sigma-70 factor (ECF subfamily)
VLLAASSGEYGRQYGRVPILACPEGGDMDAAMTGSDLPTATIAPVELMWREVVAQLTAFVRRRIADPARADDLVGEILLRIHRHVDSVDDRERLANWVFRVARNAVVDEYRRAARSREQLVATVVDTAAEESAFAGEEEADAVQELARCLRPLLEGLSPEQRRAVELIDLDGLPQRRAAQREGVSLSGMKSRVQRGRRRLAELLGQCCALTLDARGLPMDYAAPAACDCNGG